MEKRFCFEVTVDFTQVLNANNEKEAREQLKDTFKEEYNLDLEDDEITLIK